MLVTKRISRKRIIISIIVIIIIWGGISYLIFNQFFVRETSPFFSKVTVDLLVVPRIETELEDDFLSKGPYRELKKHGRWPVRVDSSEIGRDNPFEEILYSF